MDRNREFFACLALKHTRMLGPLVWRQLFSLYPSAYDAVRDAASWEARGVQGRGLRQMVKRCRNEEWREKAEKEFRDTRQAGMDVVTWFDPRYPDKLKELPDPPALLYAQGDVNLLCNPAVAVVGARECTRFGLDAAGRISTQLSKAGVTVVSGLALGIDRQAHLGGLKGIGGSIAVLGCGLDVGYPPRNNDLRARMGQEGLVISEYGPGVEPRSGHFPVRNRLISGLSLGVLVAEAAHRSGSLITARLAGEQGREVFALPGPLGQPTFTGCHKLIKDGAALVESADDILEILRYDFARELEGVIAPGPLDPDEAIDESESRVKEVRKTGKKSVSKVSAGLLPAERTKTVEKRSSAVERLEIVLNDEEKAVMSLLENKSKIHIDAIGRELGWETARISQVLLMLEMRGAVRQLPGMWYLARENE